jgi:OOP family OmpA-OmpF porin
MALALTCSNSGSKRFYGEIFNGTVGITVYLGKKWKARWLGNSYRQRCTCLNKSWYLETMLIDTDQDGVADYLDLEKTQFLV